MLHAHRIPDTKRLARPALATAEELRAAAAVPYRRNSAQLLALLALSDGRSASPPESHLRLLLHE
ncbi:MAG: hypothetical protein QM606_06905 [Leucobacter sp.]